MLQIAGPSTQKALGVLAAEKDPGTQQLLRAGLLDPRSRRLIRKEDLHETDYTPWEGHEVAAWPSMTILRGKIVVENGQFHASVSDGQFLQRKIPDEIRSRPAV